MNQKKGRGRRRGPEERARLAKEYLQSGQSAAEFARALGVGEASLVRWLKESGRAVGGRRARADRRQLVPVMLGPGPVSAEHIEISFGDGRALRAPVGIAPAQLEAFLTAVRKRSTCPW